MEALREHRIRPFEATVHAFAVELPTDYSLWHFHEDVELVVITSGSGLRYVGDSIEDFNAGEVVLLGGMLPHFWCPADSPEACRAEVLHFDGRVLCSLAEFDEFRALISLASRGLRFPYELSDTIARLIRGARDPSPPKRVSSSVSALSELADVASSATALASAAYRERSGEHRGARSELRINRTDAVMGLIAHHFAEPLVQADVAREVGLSPASFARFFRRETGRTFTRYLQEVRVSEASRLLSETDIGVTAIAGSVGFRNIAHFNRTFRRLKGVTPTEWRSAFQEHRRLSLRKQAAGA
jgi:AraC-like DNA-binding protein